MQKDRYTLEDFNFDLPRELIAQHPREKRDSSRLFVLDRRSGSFTHSEFSRLPAFLQNGDLLVGNDTKVIHARIACKKMSGGSVELLLTRQAEGRRWEAIATRMKRLKPGEVLSPVKDGSVSLTVLNRLENHIEIESNIILDENTLKAIGEIALPPYIRREASSDDEGRYQTVFAAESGAVAAPTAGLHFTEGLVRDIKAGGADMAFITLHVSWGTFRPVRSRNIGEHIMHTEKYSMSEQTAGMINSARGRGGRIIAVGTTALRVLESTYADGINAAGSGETGIFIYPPMRVKSIDALITNFHTPYSTLLMLVSAFAGHETIMKAYREAVRERYRFFSYGDAMLIV